MTYPKFPHNETGKYRVFVYAGPHNEDYSPDELSFDTLAEALFYCYENNDMLSIQLPNSTTYEWTEFDRSMFLSPFVDWTDDESYYNGTNETPLEVKERFDNDIFVLKTRIANGEKIPGLMNDRSHFDPPLLSNEFIESIEKLSSFSRQLAHAQYKTEQTTTEIEKLLSGMTSEQKEAAKKIILEAELDTSRFSL